MRTRQCEVFSFFQAQVEIIDVGTCQVDEVSWIECVFGLRIGTPAPPPPPGVKEHANLHKRYLPGSLCSKLFIFCFSELNLFFLCLSMQK